MHDIAVIGGGINGAGIARDAAGRGAKVVLIERGDLARGTSSASTKLIHGGLRYLEHYEFGLVRESLIEREKLWAIAPHIIHPMRFVLPWRKGLRPRWMLRAGLFLYDHIGGRRLLPATRTLNLRHDVAGTPLKDGFTTAFEYSDGWVDDARLVVLNAMDAAERGADIRTCTEAISLERVNGHWNIILSDGNIVQAHAIVNATGPAVLDLLARTKGHQRDPEEQIRLVRGSHIVVRRLFEHDRAYFFQNPDGRIFFAIPYEREFTLIGTTDADHHGGLDSIKASTEEIGYLCEAANGYFRKAVTPADIVWSYAGVRPLVDDGSGKPEAASRGYHFDLDLDEQGGAPLLSVFGGKITTYRHLAEGAMAELAPHLECLAGKDWTASAALPGGDFAIDELDAFKTALAADYPFLDTRMLDRISRAYGTRVRRWLGPAKQLSDLGEDFGAGLYVAEVDYLMTHEWARTSEDILWRRSKLGLLMKESAQARLDKYLRSKTF